MKKGDLKTSLSRFLHTVVRGASTLSMTIDRWLKSGSVLGLGSLTQKFRFRAMFLSRKLRLYWFLNCIVTLKKNDEINRREEWAKTCEGDEQCLYDGAAMGSLEIGERTKNSHRYYRLLHESMKSGIN